MFVTRERIGRSIWFSRYILAWELSVTVDGQFCLDALQRALATRRSTMFNTDQGPQFPIDAFTGVLHAACVQISMDGRARALGRYLGSYNDACPHQSLNYQTPAAVYAEAA